MDSENTYPSHSSSIQELYYGNPNKKCNLSSIPGLVWEFKPDDLQVNNNNYILGQVLKNKAPFDYMGKDYKDIYVPCTPASEILLKDYSESIKKEDISDKIITNPLIKTHQKGEFEGYTSGKRSCIISANGTYYRLKGCGNLEEGFPVEGFQSKNPEAREIRGCQFYNTATREQYMTENIADILAKYNIQCGNKPVGIWLYPDQEEAYTKLSIKNMCPRIDKFCGVFETLGEKRLATHLLQGVEVFLHFLIDNYCKKSVTNEDFLQLFPPERLLTDDPTLAITPLSWLGPFLDIPDDKTLHQWTENPVYPEEAFTQLLNMNEACKTSGVVIQELFGDVDVNEVVNKFIERYSSASAYKEIIQSLFDSLLGNKKLSFIQLLSFFYARIGWECGTIKRIFQDNNINWGYYADHNVLYHCNAHPNNFIVLPQGLSNNLLAPLDFDLSFFKENFINIEEATDTYGQNDGRMFDTFLNCERYHLEEALSGEENMANFGYSLFKLESQDEQKKAVYATLKTALRDTCIYYYRKAYDKLEDEEMRRYDALKDETVYSLINIALIITKDIIV